jgi:oligosaccharide repeat unit polymerase
VLFALVLVFGWMVISTVGGVEAAITRPGMSMVHGVVMYMIFTSLGKIPSLHNIALDKKNNWLAGSLFLFVTLIFLFNSRFLTVFVLLQMIILFHYCRREISKTILLSSAAICFLIIIVFGLYRDLGSSVNISEVDNIYSALSAHVDQRNIWDWFYGINIEGFTGLAGLLTFEAGRGGISHDLGISNISVIFQFIPSSLRFSETLPFNDMREFFGSMYPGTGSIVSSGMENSYAHFGLLGVIGLGILLGYLMQWLHVQMLNQKTNRLLIALISVHALQLIRGSFYNALFFGLSEVIVLFIFILLQRYFNMAEFAARAVKQRAE